MKTQENSANRLPESLAEESEDIGLARAIEEGKHSKPIRREVVWRLLSKGRKR